jgi:hypothetical protein
MFELRDCMACRTLPKGKTKWRCNISSLSTHNFFHLEMDVGVVEMQDASGEQNAASSLHLLSIKLSSWRRCTHVASLALGLARLGGGTNIISVPNRGRTKKLEESTRCGKSVGRSVAVLLLEPLPRVRPEVAL